MKRSELRNIIREELLKEKKLKIGEFWHKVNPNAYYSKKEKIEAFDKNIVLTRIEEYLYRIYVDGKFQEAGDDWHSLTRKYMK